MTPAENNLRRQKKFKERERNKKRDAHWKERNLAEVARGLAKEVPAFANATAILANIEDINEALSSYMNAGVAVLGERFPQLVHESLNRALNEYDSDGNVVKEGDKSEARFLIQKMIDLKPLVVSGSFQNQVMMDQMASLLEDEGTKVVATERKIEVQRGNGPGTGPD